MRIAVVEPVGRSGMIHYAFQLCRALAHAGAEVTLVTERRYELARLEAPFAVERLLDLWDPKPSGARPAPPGLAGAPKKALQRARRGYLHYREWARLHGYLARTHPDIVQLGDIRFPADVVPLTALRHAGLRLVDICHNVHRYAGAGRRAGGFQAGRLTRRAFRRIYRQFDHVFVHHEVNRRAFLEAYGPDAAALSVIPHGNERLFTELRDPTIDEGTLRRRLELPPGAPVVLLFGTLARYKGADLLLEAFARVRRRVPSARLVLAGYPMDDFDLAHHRELARRLGIAEAVRFHCQYVPSEEVAAWMRLAAVAVYPYREVFQSGAVQVAIAFGVPVVAARVGAMPEVLRHGVDGLLVPPEDTQALSAALCRLLTDRVLAENLGRSAAESALGRFGWDGIATLLLRRYQELLRNGPSRDRRGASAPGGRKGR